MLFERIVRPTLYRLARSDAELVHQRTVGALSGLARWNPVLAALRSHYSCHAPRTVLGMRFANPIGLAAGMDKDGTALHAWPALGLGFVEVGTVTRHAQPGNPKPRLFHLPDSEAVLNRMGFNNAGADALAARLRSTGKPTVPLGISIGKSQVTPIEDAVADYAYSMRLLRPYADYFAVNISSPNTPGLRSLQDRAALTELLSELRSLSNSTRIDDRPTPLLVKVSPDMTNEALAELLEVCAHHRADGVIATNTTARRSGIANADLARADEPGGISGRPLTGVALETVRFVTRETGGELPVIGVGGITAPDDALRMLDAGASLLQLYTGFALHGPGLPRRIGKRLERRGGT